MPRDNKHWKIAPSLPEKTIKSHQDFSRIFLQLLFNRGIFDLSDNKKAREEKIKKFFNPSYKDLGDPLLLKGVEKSIDRIKRAILAKEKIAVFGDYDADGVTSTALLYEVFKFLGMDIFTYIPHRHKEGYGLNEEALKIISEEKINLLITVDCGIRNIKEIELAKKLGIDVIITDHHEVFDDIPDAYSVINPKQKGCSYKFKKLAGVGVAFKLAQALIEELSPGTKGEIFLKWLLDFVAIGTIADCVPLSGENRILTKFGLIVFDKTKRVGLKELKNFSKNGKGDSMDFFIIPRINAVGRLDHASWVLDLLTTNSKIEAFRLTNKMEELNKERQKVTARIISEAKKELGGFEKKDKIIILANREWSSAVSGIVAGRLAEEYKVPALIIEKGDKLSKGSGRSYNGFNLFESLESIKDLFEKIGGHKQAVGFTYKNENHEKIVSRLKATLKNDSGKKNNYFFVDSLVEPDDLNISFCREIKELGPFGEGNPYPVFMMKNVLISEKRLVGGNHLKLNLIKNNKKFNAIGFGKGKIEDSIKINSLIDIIFKVEENYYNGMCLLQLEILDLKILKEEKILC